MRLPCVQLPGLAIIGMASLVSDGRTGPFNKSTFFCIIISPEKTLENESEDIITYEIEERQEDSDKNHRKIPQKNSRKMVDTRGTV